MKDYLNRVLIFLKQELPENYRQCISLENDRFIVSISDDMNFGPVYNDTFELINSNINRIRNRELELDFTVKSKNQERDFKILK